MTEWYRPSARHVATLLAEHIIDLCGELLRRGQRRDEMWCVGNIAGKRGESLKVHLTGRWRGRWKEWATGEQGDALDLVQAVHGFTTKRLAMDWAIRWLDQQGSCFADCPPEVSSHSTVAPTDEDRRRIGVARQVWREAGPAAGSPVETYLRGRGITDEIPSTIRYTPNVMHPPTGSNAPAMVAAVQAPNDHGCGVQLTFLTPCGTRKATASPSRITLGRVRGGAVRLAPAGPRLGLCEGVEDALSVMQAVGLPCWACLGTSGLRSVVLPSLPLAAEIVIFADHDRSGIGAAYSAAERFSAQGRRVGVAVPPKAGADFNDLLQAGTSMEGTT